MHVGGCADQEKHDEKERLEVEERGLQERKAHVISTRSG